MVSLQQYEPITYRIIGAAMRVHTELGSGFPEEVYHRALGIAMQDARLSFESQKPVSVRFSGVQVGLYYLDYFVEDQIVIELKAVSELNNAHRAQTITYLKSTQSPMGLLINFGAGRCEAQRILPPRHLK